jgi:ribosomal protein S12 methylthiotransferase accessory factor
MIIADKPRRRALETISLIDVTDLDVGSAAGLALLAALADRHGAPLAQAAKLPSRLFLLQAPWAPGLHVVGGQADSGRGPVGDVPQPPFSLAGSGEALEDALAACIGEAVERLSQIERPGDILIECAIDDIEPPVSPAVAAGIAALLAKSQRPRGAPIAWVRGRSLSDGSAVSVPADWCLRRVGAPHLGLPGAAMSTGCAAGPSFEAAASRALLELIERDAASLWWIGGQRPRPLAVDGQAMNEGVRLLGSLRQNSRRRASWLLDITSDFEVPCVAAVSVDADGRGFACGLAARLSLEAAVRAAILEMCQMELAFPISLSKKMANGEAALNDTDRRHLARATAIDAGSCELLHPLGAPRRLPPPATSDDLVHLRNIFEHQGIAAILVDLRRPEFQIAVVQALASGLQLMPSDMSSERLQRVIAATGGGERFTKGIPLH